MYPARLGGSYKTDGVEIGWYSQQIPEHHTSFALVFQDLNIQAAAAKPEMLHAMGISRVRSGAASL
jgi:hypothetical protein